MKIISSILFIFIWGLMAGCASVDNKALVTNADLTIKNIDSAAATINQVNVKSSTTGTVILGRLRRKYSARGAAPGHLDIKITRPDGTVQYKGVMSYMRNNRKSAYSNFSLALEEGIDKGSVIQIEHHETANITTSIKH